MLEGEAQEEVDEFTYLGNIVNKQSGTEGRFPPTKKTSGARNTWPSKQRSGSVTPM